MFYFYVSACLAQSSPFLEDRQWGISSMYSGLVCFEFERNKCVFFNRANLEFTSCCLIWGGGVMRWFWIRIPLDVPARNRVAGKWVNFRVARNIRSTKIVSLVNRWWFSFRIHPSCLVWEKNASLHPFFFRKQISNFIGFLRVWVVIPLIPEGFPQSSKRNP